MDVLDMFRNDPAKKEFVGRPDTSGGPEVLISAPIRVDDKSCLICHGVAASAPPELGKLYGMNNAFGCKLNDVVGAEIVGVLAQYRVLDEHGLVGRRFRRSLGAHQRPGLRFLQKE
jgi:hypothetical protein